MYRWMISLERVWTFRNKFFKGCWIDKREHEKNFIQFKTRVAFWSSCMYFLPASGTQLFLFCSTVQTDKTNGRSVRSILKFQLAVPLFDLLTSSLSSFPSSFQPSVQTSTACCRWVGGGAFYLFIFSLSAPSLSADLKSPASPGSPAQTSAPSLFSLLPDVLSPERSYLKLKLGLITDTTKTLQPAIPESTPNHLLFFCFCQDVWAPVPPPALHNLELSLQKLVGFGKTLKTKMCATCCVLRLHVQKDSQLMPHQILAQYL